MKEYCELLEIYYKMISTGSWYEDRENLIKIMDNVWNNLSKQGRKSCIEYCKKLYDKIVS